MDTSISEDTMALLKRTNQIRMAKMCRLCLEEKSLVNINIDQNFKQVLTDGNAKFLPNDRNFPQFVCAECHKLVDLLFKFNQRKDQSARLLRTYMEKGGLYPDVKMLDERREHSKKRSASPEEIEHKSKKSKKSHTSRDENGNDLKCKEGSSKDLKSQKPNSKSNRKESKESINNDKDKPVKSVSSSVQKPRISVC